MNFQQIVKRLRRDLPPLLPVRVYVRDQVGEGWLGATDLKFKGRKPTHFVVEVRRGHPQVMRDTLMHEWAHAVAWRHGHETVCDHDPEWALAYARIYQHIVEP